MLLEDVLVEMKWERRNKPIYTKLGYSFTVIGDVFLVKPIHLSPKSQYLVTVQCDYCKEKYKMTMAAYTKGVVNNEYVKKCSCDNCKHLKTQETNMKKHGVKSTLMLNSTKELIMKTNIERYGVVNPAKSEVVKEKMKNTNLERYGVESVTLVPEIRQKQLDTNIERYGFEYGIQNEEVKKKSMNTLYENNQAPTSRTQKYLHELLGGKLNYPLGNFYIDILLNDNIAFEYDGGGHDLQVKLGKISEEEFIKKERSREYYFKRRGYKIIRLVSSRDRLPNKDILLEVINRCLEYVNESGTNSEINIDQGFLRFGKEKTTYDFGYLVRMDKEYFERTS